MESLDDPQLDLIQEATPSNPDMQITARATRPKRQRMRPTLPRCTCRPWTPAPASPAVHHATRSRDPLGQGDAYTAVRNIGASLPITTSTAGVANAPPGLLQVGEARAAQVDQQAARLTLAADVAKTCNEHLGQAHIVATWPMTSSAPGRCSTWSSAG